MFGADADLVNPGHGYKISISNEQKTANVIIGSSWTQGLAVHPVGTSSAGLFQVFPPNGFLSPNSYCGDLRRPLFFLFSTPHYHAHRLPRVLPRCLIDAHRLRH